MLTLFVWLVVSGAIVGGFGYLAWRSDRPIPPKLTDGTSPSVPALPPGDGPYRTTDKDGTEIVPVQTSAVIVMPLSDEELFEKLLMAQHCLEPDDPQLVSWANSISTDYLVSQLKNGQDDAAILAFQIRMRPEDAAALKPLASDKWDHHKSRVAQALKGNESSDAMVILVELIGADKDYVRRHAKETLDASSDEQIFAAMSRVLSDPALSPWTQSKIIEYLSDRSENDTAMIAQVLAMKLKRNDLSQNTRHSTSAQLAKLPGGKELLRDLLN